jgi:hypothetical protein
VHDEMNISVQKLLTKIEEELKLAKSNANEKSLREKVYSIKILCELILDEKQMENEKVIVPTVIPATINQPYPTSISVNQPQKLNDEDGANGDSLFDF